MEERLTRRDKDGNAVAFNYIKTAGEFKEVVDRLAEYEDLEEQGLIKRLPCKIDTFVYAVDKFIDRIIYGQLTNIAIDRYCVTYTVLDSEYNQYYHCRMVFLTQAEAEKKLKELKRKSYERENNK